MTVKRLTIPVTKQTVGVQPHYMKSTYIRLIVKQQMRLGEDSPQSNIKTTSKTRAQQPATRSSFDPIEYV